MAYRTLSAEQGASCSNSGKGVPLSHRWWKLPSGRFQDLCSAEVYPATAHSMHASGPNTSAARPWATTW